MTLLQAAVKDFTDTGGNVIIDQHDTRCDILFTTRHVTDRERQLFPVFNDGVIVNSFLDTDIGGLLLRDLPFSALIGY